MQHKKNLEKHIPHCTPNHAITLYKKHGGKECGSDCGYDRKIPEWFFFPDIFQTFRHSKPNRKYSGQKFLFLPPPKNFFFYPTSALLWQKILTKLARAFAKVWNNVKIQIMVQSAEHFLMFLKTAGNCDFSHILAELTSYFFPVFEKSLFLPGGLSARIFPVVQTGLIFFSPTRSSLCMYHSSCSIKMQHHIVVNI